MKRSRIIVLFITNYEIKSYYYINKINKINKFNFFYLVTKTY